LRATLLQCGATIACDQWRNWREGNGANRPPGVVDNNVRCNVQHQKDKSPLAAMTCEHKRIQPVSLGGRFQQYLVVKSRKWFAQYKRDEEYFTTLLCWEVCSLD